MPLNFTFVSLVSSRFSFVLPLRQAESKTNTKAARTKSENKIPPSNVNNTKSPTRIKNVILIPNLFRYCPFFIGEGNNKAENITNAIEYKRRKAKECGQD